MIATVNGPSSCCDWTNITSRMCQQLTAMTTVKRSAPAYTAADARNNGVVSLVAAAVD